MDSATESENIEKLAKEAESLKIRLEDERQKLNDVTRKYKIIMEKDLLCEVIFYVLFFFIIL